MGDVQVLSICEASTENGYILKNFFSLLATKGTPNICFQNNQIITVNETVDSKLLVSSYLNGEEINLKWVPEIPIEHRYLNLTVDSKAVINNFAKIKKKDKAGIVLKKVDEKTEGADYILFVVVGEGGDRRESIHRIAARRNDQPKQIVANPPLLQRADCLTVPIKSFHQMVNSYSKCKGTEIKIEFYPGIDPGIMMTTAVRGGSKIGPIIERYGSLPEVDREPPSPVGPVYVGGMKLDDSLIVRSGGESTVRLVCQDEVLGSNDFIIHSEKISNFVKFASLHSEGSVRIYYSEGCDLLFAFRFGSFGEATLIITKNEYLLN